MRSHSKQVGPASALAAALTTLVACAIGHAAPISLSDEAPAGPATAQLATSLPDVTSGSQNSSGDLVCAVECYAPQHAVMVVADEATDIDEQVPSWPLYRLAPKASPPRM